MGGRSGEAGNRTAGSGQSAIPRVARIGGDDRDGVPIYRKYTRRYRGRITMGSGADTVPALVTVTLIVPLPPGGRASYGICALICPAETKSSGAAIPLKDTDTFDREVESGTVSACARPVK